MPSPTKAGARARCPLWWATRNWPGLAQLPHIDDVREAGSEGIELMMWLIARGAMADIEGGPLPRVAQRFHHVPASNTAVGHLILENT